MTGLWIPWFPGRTRTSDKVVNWPAAAPLVKPEYL